MGTLDGKVVVVTGSSRGLGLAIAQACAQEGASVVLSARSADLVQSAVDTLKQQDARVSGIVADVSDFSQVTALAHHAKQVFGRLDVWVNNAGLAGVYGPTADIDPLEFERVVHTNIFGTYYGSMVALQHFQAHETAGKLINLLGHGDSKPVAFQSAYAASKSWVRSFTLALAKENASKPVGIYAFNPGLVNTDLLHKVEAVRGYEQRLDRFKIVIRLLAQPPEVPAQKVVWLASSATDGKTGLEVRLLDRKQALSALVGDVKRRIMRRPASEVHLDIKSVEPYKQK